MKMRKLICAFCACVLTVSLLASCGGTSDVLYIEDAGGKKVVAMNENMFSYHLSDNKTYYLLGIGATTDAAEFWNASANIQGKTIGDMAFDSVVSRAKKMLAGAYLYESLRSSTPESKELFTQMDIQIEKQVDALESQLVSSMGSKSALSSYLSGFGVDLKNLREYYTLSFKEVALRSTLAPDEQEKKEYFSQNYSIVKHILVNTSFKVKEDGSKVSLSEEEIATKLALADSINARLSAGEAFEDLWEEYKDADATGAAMYPDGYFVSADSNYTASFKEAALDMAVGELRTVKSDYGVHIIKKYPMDAEKYNLYESIASELETAVTDKKYAELIAPYAETVKINSEALSQFSIVSAPIMLG